MTECKYCDSYIEQNFCAKCGKEFEKTIDVCKKIIEKKLCDISIKVKKNVGIINSVLDFFGYQTDIKKILSIHYYNIFNELNLLGRVLPIGNIFIIEIHAWYNFEPSCIVPIFNIYTPDEYLEKMNLNFLKSNKEWVNKTYRSDGYTSIPNKLYIIYADNMHKYFFSTPPHFEINAETIGEVEKDDVLEVVASLAKIKIKKN